MLREHYLEVFNAEKVWNGQQKWRPIVGWRRVAVVLLGYVDGGGGQGVAPVWEIEAVQGVESARGEYGSVQGVGANQGVEAARGDARVHRVEEAVVQRVVPGDGGGRGVVVRSG